MLEVVAAIVRAVRNHVVPKLVAAGFLPAVREAADDAIRAAVAGELRLLDPHLRRSPELAAELLHPDFVEFGASGRRWDAVSVLAAMAGDADAGGGEPPIEATEVSGTLLAPDVVHVTYVSDAGGRRARPSSIWRRDAAGRWRVWFHQGTLTDER